MTAKQGAKLRPAVLRFAFSPADNPATDRFPQVIQPGRYIRFSAPGEKPFSVGPYTPGNHATDIGRMINEQQLQHKPQRAVGGAGISFGHRIPWLIAENRAYAQPVLFPQPVTASIDPY